MEQKESSDKTKSSKLLPWIIAALLIILLAAVAAVGLSLVLAHDSSEASQMRGLAMLIALIMVIFVFAVIMFHYLEIRYIQLPAWRWIARGFEGELELPFPRFSWATKSAMAQARRKMNKRQRACVWFGNICCFAGMILMIYDVAWRGIFTIKGESHIGSIPAKLFWVGILSFFIGICVSGLLYHRILKNTAPSGK